MKINHPLVKGVVKEVKPFIYCVEVDDDYDRAMLFCRYQEFYESPYKKFRGKPFGWMEYMRFYKDAWKKNVKFRPKPVERIDAADVTDKATKVGAGLIGLALLFLIK